MAAVDVAVSSCTTIKPASATPPHLRTWKLSMIDQFIPNHQIIFILFYSQSPSHPPAAIVAHLKLSLSHALTKFYPLAGRLHEPTSTVDCSDQGVAFLEAQAPDSVDLAGFLLLKPGSSDLLRQLVPGEGACTAGCSGGELLAVQATVFNCGGVALGLRISHKIGDGVSYISFLQSWATTGGGDVVLESSYFPPVEVLETVPGEWPTERTVQQRFVFDGSQLTALRSANGVGGASQFPTPTRVEVVTGLFWRAIIRARTGLGPTGKGLALHAVNLRKHMLAPAAETLLGNFALPVILTEEEEEEDGSWRSLGLKLGSVVRELNYTKLQAARGPGRRGLVLRIQEEMDRLPLRCTFSSWCRFPVYEVDFGWGKPAWVAFAGPMRKNTVVLVDRKDGEGVEAWVSLEQDEMECLLRDEELLSHATLS